MDTQAVLAILAGALLTAGIAVHRSGRESGGFALFGIGFSAAALWGGIGARLSQRPRDPTSHADYLALAVTGAVLALYFFRRARRAADGG